VRAAVTAWRRLRVRGVCEVPSFHTL
jgi:hypothetical protein